MVFKPFAICSLNTVTPIAPNERNTATPPPNPSTKLAVNVAAVDNPSINPLILSVSARLS